MSRQPSRSKGRKSHAVARDRGRVADDAPSRASSNTDWLGWLGLLGDSARVRLLRLVSRDELGVGELARALQMPQSTVSRHLKPLFDAGWIAKRTEGTASLYRAALDSQPAAARELWTLTAAHFDTAAISADDDHRLAAVLAERHADTKAFFGRIGGEWSTLRRDLFGAAFSHEALLGLIDPALTVADLGCGTGEACEVLAPLVSRVVAIDRERAMLDAARKRLRTFGNVEFREGELSRLPLRDGEVDAAVMVLVLHHIERPEQVIAEAGRTLRARGLLLVVDMVAHDRSEWRHTMGHVHLGFSDHDVRAWDGAGDLRLVRSRRLTPDTQAKGPGLFAALWRKA